MRKGWGILIGAVLLGVALWFALARQVPATSDDGSSPRSENSPGAPRGASRAGFSRGPEGGGQGASMDEGSPVALGDAGLCSLGGHVLDENGQPLSGFSVVVLASALHRSVYVVDTATTDGNGSFEMGCLSPGSYTVYADGPGYLEDRQPLVVASETESRTLDFVLPFAQVVSGTVVDESGHPVSEARVNLSAGEDESRESISVESEEDGTFSLDAPKAGKYVAELYHSDYLFTEVPVTAPQTGLKLVLKSGTNVDVEVVDESGRPVNEAKVRVQAVPESGEDEPTEKSDTTDETGRASLKGFEPGKYLVMAVTAAEGHPRTVKRELEFRSAGTLRVRLQLEAGQRLSGTVVDDSGRPVEGAEVRAAPMALAEASGKDNAVLEPALALTQEAWDFGDVSPVLTGPDGRFVMNHVPPGAYVLMASKQGYTFAPQGERRRMMGEEPGVLASAGASDVRLVLDFQGLIRGRVIHEDGSPVPSFQLNGARMDSEQGTFVLSVHRTEDRVLTFSAMDLAGTERRVHARRGELVDLGDIVLHKGREVLFRVVDAETSQPVRRASVDLETLESGEAGGSHSLLFRPVEHLISHSGRPLSLGVGRSFATQEDGTVLISGVAEQALRLRVTHDEYLPESMTLGAQQGEVLVRLRSGARVKGHVSVGTEAAERGVVLVLAPNGEVQELAAISQGAYALGPLRAGNYFLVVKDAVSETRTPVFVPVPVQVPESGTLTVDLEAQRSGTTMTVETSEKAELLALVPGSMALPGSTRLLRLLINLGVQSRAPGGGVHFELQGLASGRYTLFAVREWGVNEMEVHREEVDVPARDTVSLTVRPGWVRLPGEPEP